MRRETLDFLKCERDVLNEELRRLREGERKVLAGGAGSHEITLKVIDEVEARLHPFEELIAASEAGLA